MIAAVGRAEALAAVALVVGSRQEPVAALRRLAGEDPSLRRLAKVADRCAAGEPLPEALRRERLLRKKEAAALAGMTPEITADELTRIAQSRAVPSAGEILARWLPVWALLAATVPSLAIGGAVAVVANRLYFARWYYVWLPPERVLGGAWWLVEIGAVAIAVLAVAVDWWVLRSLPGLRRLTRFSPDLEWAIALEDLLRSARAQRGAQEAYERWARLSGDPHQAREMLARAGDPAAALMELGVVPRRPDGGPDWDEAIAGAARIRARHAATLSPWLSAIVLLAGVAGFLIWSVLPMQLYPGASDLISDPAKPVLDAIGVASRSPLRELVPNILLALGIAAAAVVVAHYAIALVRVVGRLSGAGRDWPVVAARVAAEMERREDVAAALRGLRLGVRRSMRRRLDRALRSDEARLGLRLADTGVAPFAQRAAIRAADAADLPALLRATAEAREDHGTHIAIRQAAVVVMLTSAVALIAAWLLHYRLYEAIPRYYAISLDAARAWMRIGYKVSFAGAACVLAVGVAVAIGRRFGWWILLDGWTRRACGLATRRLLAAGAREADLARAASTLVPRAGRALAAAGERGDLPGLLAILGWRASSREELDRALAADLRRGDRRRARLATAARIALPLLVGVPVACVAGGQMLALVTVESVMITRSAQGYPYPSGTPAMMLLYWATARCEAQGEAVVDDYRERRLHPPIPVLPRTKLSEKQNKKP